MGAFAVTYKEFSLTTIAAILTVIGYSMNDTIVVFDRIRENASRLRDKKFPEVVNTSVNETLSRTILTSMTVFFVTLAMNIWGTGVIRDFAFAMNVGVIVGTLLFDLRGQPDLDLAEREVDCQPEEGQPASEVQHHAGLSSLLLTAHLKSLPMRSWILAFSAAVVVAAAVGGCVPQAQAGLQQRPDQTARVLGRAHARAGRGCGPAVRSHRPNQLQRSGVCEPGRARPEAAETSEAITSRFSPESSSVVLSSYAKRLGEQAGELFTASQAKDAAKASAALAGIRETQDLPQEHR